jgi:hypothetical protein
MKRLIPLWICVIAGFAMIVASFIPATLDWGEKASIWFDVLAAIAYVLGGGSLLKVHLKKVSDRGAGYAYSLITLVAFAVTLYVGFGKVGVHPSPNHPEVAWSGDHLEPGSAFWWLYSYAFKPLQATMFSLLAFYVASAAFRAFRAKNIDAVLLLGTAFIVLLGRTYAGAVLTDWIPDELAGLRIENLTTYIMDIFNKAGNRAIQIGIALGVAATSLKILLGVDRSYLGTTEE